MSANSIKLDNGTYTILDVLNNVTIPDCIVFNKTGTGHGEKKMYVGSVNNANTLSFFDDFDRDCFFLKSDLEKFMIDVKPEFETPQQHYSRPDRLMTYYARAKEELDKIKEKFNVVGKLIDIL